MIADGCEKDSFNWWGLREEHSAFGYLHHDLRKRKEEKIKINEEIYREKKKRELEEIEEERKKKEEERRVQQEKLWKAQALQKSVNSGSGNIQNYIPHSVQYQNNNHNYNHKSRFRDAPSVPIGTGGGGGGVGSGFFPNESTHNNHTTQNQQYNHNTQTYNGSWISIPDQGNGQEQGQGQGQSRRFHQNTQSSSNLRTDFYSGDHQQQQHAAGSVQNNSIPSFHPSTQVPFFNPPPSFPFPFPPKFIPTNLSNFVPRENPLPTLHHPRLMINK